MTAPGSVRWRRFQRMRRRRTPDLVAGFWFLAVIVALLGPVLAVLTLLVDKHSGPGGFIPELIISPDSARTILGSISGSLITIASLTSSLTIVTLQLLSNQYTPRTVRGFLATRLSQAVLGGFIGIFLYCLILLVTVREQGEANAPFVPTLGVLVSVALAVIGLIMLVIFIHAMSQTIQVSTMAARIAADTTESIERVHGAAREDDGLPAPVLADGLTRTAVRQPKSGYLRGVDVQELLAELQTTGLVAIQVVSRPGDFVTPSTIMVIVCGDGPPSEPVLAAIRDSLVVEREREIMIDPGYGIRQLTDIALRALSPGINDPSTAVTCMGYLRALLEDLAGRDLPGVRRIACHETVLELAEPRLADYLDPLTEIAPYAGTDARVVDTLLGCFDGIGESAALPEDRAHVYEVREQIRVGALAEARLPRDKQRLAGPPPSPLVTGLPVGHDLPATPAASTPDPASPAPSATT